MSICKLNKIYFLKEFRGWLNFERNFVESKLGGSIFYFICILIYLSFLHLLHIFNHLSSINKTKSYKITNYLFVQFTHYILLPFTYSEGIPRSRGRESTGWKLSTTLYNRQDIRIRNFAVVLRLSVLNLFLLKPRCQPTLSLMIPEAPWETLVSCEPSWSEGCLGIEEFR